MGESELDDFGAFYRRTYAAAYRTALGITSNGPLAEDVAQEAFCSAYRGRARFRGAVPAEVWLQRIVVNEAFDQLRRGRVRPTVELDPDLAIQGGEIPAAAVERMTLLRAVECLNPRQRAAIVLRYFHGYPLRTVGAVLGTSEGGATMLVQRALVTLRQTIGDRTDPIESATGAGGPEEAHGGR